jgi:hypothetical protein|nr:MAG TPA: hypothetical protein [Caudoviricetes sp.]
MSYTVEWIEPIYNRSYGDIQAVTDDPYLENAIGAYNAVDINRIENDTQYVMEYMLDRRIIRSVPEGFSTSRGWEHDDIVTKTDVSRIIGNVIILMELSNPEIQGDLEPLSPSAQITYRVANAIEKNLEIMKNQPDLPVQRFWLELEHGIIQEYNTNAGWIAENEVVTIRGVPYGEYAQFMNFTGWSGSAEDLLCLANPLAQTTTLTMPFRNVSLTATFETRIPRTLILNSGHICESGIVGPTGPSQITCYAGDRLLIVAEVAASGKAFWNWTGTQEAIDNLTGGEEPSSSWLVMPDCDVELTAHYINAGEHSVTIYQPTGNEVNWYDYDEYVSIYPASRGNKWVFDYWSGSTQYLEDIHDSGASFKMPDVNLTFTPHYRYNYSYNTVRVTNGTVDGQTEITGAMETSNHTITAGPAPEGQGFYNWTLEGVGSFANQGDSPTTFTVGDGNAILTATYKNLHRLTVTNLDNSGSPTIYDVVEGKTKTLSTNSRVGDYKFNGWYEGETRLSTLTSYTITMGTGDRTIEARYDYTPTYTVTLVNRNNGGATTTYSVFSGDYWNSSTTEEVGDYLFVRWLKDNSQVSTSLSYGFYVYGDTTITVEYRPKETYHLTVNNGSGSGDYKERQSVTITADEGDFSDWSYSGLYNIGSTTSRTTTVKLGRGDGTVTANYNLRSIQVITNSGTNNYSIRQGNTQNINANPAPSTYEFDQWEVVSGDATFGNYLSASTYVRAGSENSVVRATYKPIPYFTITVQNGYVQDGQNWVTSGTFLRNSNVPIKMIEAPEGYQFLQWEILQGNQNAVYQPRAETTYVQNLLENVIVRATYYIPDPEIQYTLTITRKDGSVETSQHSVGERVTIYADFPDEGYEFRRWTGDTQYVNDRYSETAIVNMPARNIELAMQYKQEGATEKFHVVLRNGELLVSSEEDPETHETIETWSDNGEFEEGSVVPIRAINIPHGYSFYRWWNPDDDGKSMSTVTELENPNTTLTVEDFDITLERAISENDKYTLTLRDGQRGGTYYENDEVPLYFSKTDTDTIHYNWKRWMGPDINWAIANLRVKTQSGTKAFDPFDDGDYGDDAQIILMPTRHLELWATYDEAYRLRLINGTADGSSEVFNPEDTEITIVANPAPQGKVFWKWSGDTDYVEAIFDSTTKVYMPATPINLTALYEDASDPSDIGYTSEDLYGETQVDTSDITVISGTIGFGFILTDVKGHMYMVSELVDQTATIVRLTQKQSGGDV